ncbi:MAG: hypothetical protein AB7F64_08660, partial [Gammaproteobacteria bacterium]
KIREVATMLYILESLDADGCLLNPNFAESREHTLDVVLHNQHLLQEIIDTAQSYQDGKTQVQLQVISGSNRGDLKYDQSNSKQASLYKGPYFQQLIAFTTALFEQLTKNGIPVQFHPFIMADLYADLPPGTSVEKILNFWANTVANGQLRKFLEGHSILGNPVWQEHENLLVQYYSQNFDPNIQHACWVFDESKITLLYAQMHMAACQALNDPNARIIFNFRDDREDILTELNEYFEKYPGLIPENMVLNLYQYNGTAKSKLFASIQGTGEVDRDYKNTIKSIANIFKQTKKNEMQNIETSELHANVRSWMKDTLAAVRLFDLEAIIRLISYKDELERRNVPAAVVRAEQISSLLTPMLKFCNKIKADIPSMIHLYEYAYSLEKTDKTKAQAMYQLHRTLQKQFHDAIPKNLMTYLNKLEAKALHLKTEGKEEAAQVVSTLHDELQWNAVSFFANCKGKTDRDIHDYVVSAEGSFRRAEKVLSTHRDYKDLALAIGLTIITLGTYAVVAGISRWTIGRWNFFNKTDSHQLEQTGREIVAEAADTAIRVLPEFTPP